MSVIPEICHIAEAGDNDDSYESDIVLYPNVVDIKNSWVVADEDLPPGVVELGRAAIGPSAYTNNPNYNDGRYPKPRVIY